MKQCTKCKQVKPLNEFPKRKRNQDGHDFWCGECNRANARAHYRRNRESELAQRRQYIQGIMQDPDKHAQFREKINRMNRGLREEALMAYGGKCACCGEGQFEFLAIDHINGNGSQERRTMGSGIHFIRKLRKSGWPSGYRVLCHNCNAARGYYGYCPHEKSEPVETIRCAPEENRVKI